VWHTRDYAPKIPAGSISENVLSVLSEHLLTRQQQKISTKSADTGMGMTFLSWSDDTIPLSAGIVMAFEFA